MVGRDSVRVNFLFSFSCLLTAGVDERQVAGVYQRGTRLDSKNDSTCEGNSNACPSFISHRRNLKSYYFRVSQIIEIRLSPWRI